MHAFNVYFRNARAVLHHVERGMSQQRLKSKDITARAVCRKLLTRIYFVLKEERPYQVRTKH